MGLNAWAWQEKQALAAKQVAVRGALTTTFPRSRWSSMPPVQMERELTLLRQKAGSVSPRDLEPLMAAAGGALPDGRVPSAVEFAPGELRLRGVTLAPDEESVFNTRLQAAGYRARIEDGTLLVRSEGHAMSRTTALQARWKALAPREQNLVLAAGGIVALALVWWVALAPALATLRQAPELHRKLDLQLQHMQRLQAEAQQLQAQPQTSPSDAVGALRTALTQRLGTAAQMNVLGDRVTVTLKAAPADATAEWLALARTNARAVTVEARLTRSNAAAPSNARPGHTGQCRRPCRPRWDGTVVLALPAR